MLFLHCAHKQQQSARHTLHIHTLMRMASSRVISFLSKEISPLQCILGTPTYLTLTLLLDNYPMQRVNIISGCGQRTIYFETYSKK